MNVKRYEATLHTMAFGAGDIATVVRARDYDALQARCLMAEDAANKGDKARLMAAGMEMEINELQTRVAKLVAALRKIVWMTEHEHEMRGLDDAWEVARDALSTSVNQS